MDNQRATHNDTPARDNDGWMLRAQCRTEGLPVDAFFPTRGADIGYEPFRSALACCQRCPVTRACLDYALEHHEPGIWGGTTGRERKRITQQRARAARAAS